MGCVECMRTHCPEQIGNSFLQLAMTNFHKIYTAIWIIGIFVSIILFFHKRYLFSFTQRKYLFFLLKPWKLVTFILATAFMTIIAPFSGDYTWDYVTGFVMSVLTYVTAPWVVGIFYRFRIRKAVFPQLFVAFCLWMVSVSWFYDLYLYFRDKVYPPTWLSNIALSSILYFCGGLWCNLNWTSERGVHFSFTNSDDKWFIVSHQRVFGKIIRKGWIYIAIVTLLCGTIIYKLNSL